MIWAAVLPARPQVCVPHWYMLPAVGVRAARLAGRAGVVVGREDLAVLQDAHGPGGVDGGSGGGARRLAWVIDLVDVSSRTSKHCAAGVRAAAPVQDLVPGVVLDGQRAGSHRLGRPGGDPLARQDVLGVGLEVDGLDRADGMPEHADGRRRIDRDVQPEHDAAAAGEGRPGTAVVRVRSAASGRDRTQASGHRGATVHRTSPHQNPPMVLARWDQPRPPAVHPRADGLEAQLGAQRQERLALHASPLEVVQLLGDVCVRIQRGQALVEGGLRPMVAQRGGQEDAPRRARSQSSGESGICSRWIQRASTAAALFAPQPGRPG